MPSNLKKLVHERRTKTGETHQTALRHVRTVRSPKMFEEIVRRIIQLAAARNALSAPDMPSDELRAFPAVPAASLTSQQTPAQADLERQTV